MRPQILKTWNQSFATVLFKHTSPHSMPPILLIALAEILFEIGGLQRGDPQTERSTKSAELMYDAGFSLF